MTPTTNPTKLQQHNHKLKQSLTIIKGYIYRLKRTADEQDTETLNKLDDQIDEITKQINQFKPQQ